MKEPFFSPMAAEDLDSIFDHIARDNPPAAIRFVETLKEKWYTLARFPLLGASREHVAQGLRVFAAQGAVPLLEPVLDRRQRYPPVVFWWLH